MNLDPFKAAWITFLATVSITGFLLINYMPEREKRDQYGNCYHEPVNEMGESNICHQYCSPHGLHGYDTKKGQLLVCVCNDPKEVDNDN